MKILQTILLALLLLTFSTAYAGDCIDDDFDNCLVEFTHEDIDFAHTIKTDSFAFTNAQDECYEYSYLNREDIKNHVGHDIEIFSEPHEKHLVSEPLDFQNIRRYFTPKENLVESCYSLPSSDWSKYSYSEELIFFNKNIISVNKGRGEYYAGNRHGEYISQKILLDFKKRKKVIWDDIFGRGSEEFEELVYEWVFENHADKNYIGDDTDSIYAFKHNFTIHPRGLVLTIPTGFIGMYAQGELTFLVPKTLLKKYISTKKYDYYFSNPVLSEAASFDCNKASTSHEKMICNDPTLSALDGEMGRLYKQVLALDPQQLKQQRKFNKKYKGCRELDKCIRLVEGRNKILEFRVKAEQGVNAWKEPPPSLVDRGGIKYEVNAAIGYTGKYIERFENGQKKYETNYKDGKLEGLSTHWHESGKKKFEGNWKDGKEEGLHTDWYENGQKKFEGNRKDRWRDGLWTEWYKNGQKGFEGNFENGELEGLRTDWYENGQKRYEGNYVVGKDDGLHTSWHKNGQKESEGNYVVGKDDGLHTSWHKNGQKESEGNYVDWKKEGLWTRWYENGQKSSETNYKDGKQEGLHTEWHDNGQKKYETNYKDGKLGGLSTTWYENGQITKTETYKDGELVK